MDPCYYCGEQHEEACDWMYEEEYWRQFDQEVPEMDDDSA